MQAKEHIPDEWPVEENQIEEELRFLIFIEEGIVSYKSKAFHYETYSLYLIIKY